MDEVRAEIADLKTLLERAVEAPKQKANRWASRKFLAAIVTAASLGLAEYGGIQLTPETQAAIVTVILGFITAEAVNDVKAQKK